MDRLSLLINKKAKFDQDRFTKKDSLERIMMEKKKEIPVMYTESR